MPKTTRGRPRTDTLKRTRLDKAESTHAESPLGSRTIPRFIDSPGLNDEKVEQSMHKLHQLIINLVGTLTKFVTIDQYSWPQISDMHIWFDDLENLFRQAIGLREGKMLDEAFRDLEVDLEDAKVYLRMLIAAEVWEKVLTASFPQSPVPGREWAKQVLRPVASRMESPDESYVVQLFLQACAHNGCAKSTMDPNAEEFSNNLFKLINPMLMSFKNVLVVDREASMTNERVLRKNCGTIVQNIYKVAARLRMEMNLKDCTYTFFWPAANLPFDETTMDAEINMQRNVSSHIKRRKGLRVTATVLPGVRRVELQRPSHAVRTTKERNPQSAPQAVSREPSILVIDLDRDEEPESTVISKALVYMRDLSDHK